MVMNLKDINKKRIVIRRGEQKRIGVNQEIKDAIKQEANEGETSAETLNRILTTNHQMTELLLALVENMEETPSKMTDLLVAIPQNLRNLFEAIVNVRESEKE